MSGVPLYVGTTTVRNLTEAITVFMCLPSSTLLDKLNEVSSVEQTIVTSTANELQQTNFNTSFDFLSFV